MELIRRMKKREVVEITLKMLAAILTSIVAIIFMECMMYSVDMHILFENNSMKYSSDSTAYCIKVDDDKYNVIFYNPYDDYPWSANRKDTPFTKSEIQDLLNSKYIKEIVWHAPNVFIFTITPIHYIIMAIFLSGVSGFFIYKFIVLNKEYNKIIDKYNKTGTIEITNF